MTVVPGSDVMEYACEKNSRFAFLIFSEAPVSSRVSLVAPPRRQTRLKLRLKTPAAGLFAWPGSLATRAPWQG